MKSPKVSIIIVNYNQKRLTLECLKSLSKITYKNVEIIVVDNGSTDSSSSEIKAKFPKIRQLGLTENTGFVGGNNAGLELAKGKYILFLNNDTKVTPGFLEPLVEDLENDKSLGIVQSKILVMDNPELLDSFVSYQTFNGFLYHEGYLDQDQDKYNNFCYSFSAKGACMMARREVLKLGAFDDGYFLYFEETDFCWRAWVIGYTVAYEPRSIIYHKMGATSLKMKSPFIHYHSFKNRIRTILKNASGGTLLWMFPIHLVICLGLSGYFFISGQRGGSFAILKALGWNLTELDETLRLRSKVQKARKVSDKQIFSKVMKNPSLYFYFHHLSLVKANLSK
jgi:GT2 family glycosyltransferase